MKKYWLLKVETRDGEFEYSEKATYCGNESELENYVQEYFAFPDSYQVVELNGYRQIPKEDYDVLHKYGI